MTSGDSENGCGRGSAHVRRESETSLSWLPERDEKSVFPVLLVQGKLISGGVCLLAGVVAQHGLTLPEIEFELIHTQRESSTSFSVIALGHLSCERDGYTFYVPHSLWG